MSVRRSFRPVPVRRAVRERDRHAHRLCRPREDVQRAVDEGRGLVVVEDDRRPRERRVQESLFRRSPQRRLVEGRVEPPPDPLEDLPEGARGGGRGRHPARERRVEVCVRVGEPGHDEAARRIEPAARLGPEEHVTPLDGERVERDDGPARDGEAARSRSVPARRVHHPRASRSRRSTSSASAAWPLHQLSERCASSSSTVFPCCSTHVKYFRLCQRSRLSRVPSDDPVELLPVEDGRAEAPRPARASSGPVRAARRLRTDG